MYSVDWCHTTGDADMLLLPPGLSTFGGVIADDTRTNQPKQFNVVGPCVIRKTQGHCSPKAAHPGRSLCPRAQGHQSTESVHWSRSLCLADTRA